MDQGPKEVTCNDQFPSDMQQFIANLALGDIDFV